jgi:hypothetical protein
MSAYSKFSLLYGALVMYENKTLSQRKTTSAFTASERAFWLYHHLI